MKQNNERLHNSIGTLRRILLVHLLLLSSRFEWQEKIARLSTHMVSTQQEQE
jgi:hypothetical protein